MHIPFISAVADAVKSWLQKITRKRELDFELSTLHVCHFYGDYQGGNDFDSIYASIEKKYIAYGFSKEEIKKMSATMSSRP